MILDDIIEAKLIEVRDAKIKMPLDLLMKEAQNIKLASSFRSNISRPHHVNLIAEIKKASPSKGVIRKDFDPGKIAATYQACGAQAISVLTDEKFFQGKLEYIKAVKECSSLPVLRKDFIIDEYQIYESLVAGADAILLICNILTQDELNKFHLLAILLGLDVLVETHDEEDMEKAINSGASTIGINNRDLDTFKVDITATERLAKLVPSHRTIVSESGIKTCEDIMFLKSLGVNAVLIGEAFMEAPDIGAKVQEILGHSS
jgi:indole-3-glycerol phosphate synthase